MKELKIFAILLIITGIILFCYEAYNYHNNVNVEEFYFKQDKVNVKVSEKLQIPLSIVPEEYSKIVKYSSTESDIIKIVDNEYIKGIKPGATELNAKIGDKTIGLIVTVSEADNIYFSESKVVISEDEKYKLNIKANFDLKKEDVKYKIQDTSIATISNTGEIKGLKEGKTKVFARYKEFNTSIEIVISNNYYKVTYDYNGISKNKNNTVKCAFDSKTKKCKLQLPNIDASKEYKILGWSLDKDAKKEIYKINNYIEIDKNVTLYAISSKYKNKFIVNYELNGASSLSKEEDICYTDEKSCEITLPRIVRNGENTNIIGWSKDKNSKEKQYNVGEKIKLESDITLYAITSEKYIANFYKNGAKEIIVGNENNWTNNNEYLSTSCKVYNNEESCTIISPTKVITNEVYEIALGFNQNKNATTNSIGFNSQIKLNKSTLNYYSIIKIDKSKIFVPMKDYEFSKPSSVSKKKVIKVLVIEIDPILSKGIIQGKSCTGITASACLNQDKQQAINELVTDIEYSSHGIIDVQIVKTDKLNEFATHKTQVTLLNGKKSYKLDEDTWLDIMKNGWLASWQDERVKELGSYTLDYEYIIKKLNLVERRNNNEFNEIWLVNIDPTRSYESIMIGKNAYWINGQEIIKNCDNTRVMNVSISRPDTNFECNGHAAENIMGAVFDTNTYAFSYSETKVDKSNYYKLNLWQKFILNEKNNGIKNTGLSGVGNVHFSPNSKDDYDWENYTNIVASKWREWQNYPNLTNNPTNAIFNPSVYMNASIKGTKSAARLHHRWWFGLMPHLSGYTNDGYSNNWWDYLYQSDYVTSVKADKTNYTYNVGDTIDNINVKINYQSLKSLNKQLTKYENNMIFSNQSIFKIDGNGKIVASSKGTSTLKYYRDGKYVTLNIIVN